MWFNSADDIEPCSLREQLKSGEAGWITRIGVSLAALAALAAVAMLVLALINTMTPPLQYQVTQRDGSVNVYTRPRIDDEHVALGVALAAAAWCFVLTKVWATYRRFRLLMRGVFGVIGIWAVAIPLSVALDSWARPSEELWIAMTILLAAAATFLWITHVGHKAAAGRRLRQRDGIINVICPACGYSLIGLREARCPECGEQFTLDELIRRQEFALPKSALVVTDRTEGRSPEAPRQPQSASFSAGR